MEMVPSHIIRAAHYIQEVIDAARDGDPNTFAEWIHVEKDAKAISLWAKQMSHMYAASEPDDATNVPHYEALIPRYGPHSSS